MNLKLDIYFFIPARHNLDSGVEQGAGFVVYYKGEMVVEFYGGYADYDAEWSWNKDVISQVP